MRQQLTIAVAIAIATLLIQVAQTAAQERQVAVAGVVRGASSGEPVISASVAIDSQVVAVTDELGWYAVSRVSVSGPTMTVQIQRLGYETTELTVELPESDSTLRVDVTLPNSPTALKPIVVQGDRETFENPDMVGFYERREQGYGTYLTAEEVARTGVRDFTNHLRRLRVHYSDNCVVTYLDGTRLMDFNAINEWIPTSDVAGMEFHRSTDLTNLPAEFTPPGMTWGKAAFGACDVLMFWSKNPTRSPFEFGAHFGAGVGGREVRGRLVGGHLIVPVVGGETPLRLHMATSAIVGSGSHKWRAVFNLTIRPLGPGTPLYLGTGGGISRDAHVEIPLPGETLSVHHTVISGLSFDMAMLRPFVEFQVFDPLQRSRISVSSQVGVSFRMGSS